MKMAKSFITDPLKKRIYNISSMDSMLQINNLTFLLRLFLYQRQFAN